MAETAAAKRRSKAKRDEAEDAEREDAEPQAEQDEEVEESAGAEQESQAEDSGETGAGDSLPEDPEPAAPDPGAAASRENPESVVLDKPSLIQRAAELLPEYDRVVVKGVLASAPNELTLGDARERIERFLSQPVAPEPEEA